MPRLKHHLRRRDDRLDTHEASNAWSRECHWLDGRIHVVDAATPRWPQSRLSSVAAPRVLITSLLVLFLTTVLGTEEDPPMFPGLALALLTPLVGDRRLQTAPTPSFRRSSGPRPCFYFWAKSTFLLLLSSLATTSPMSPWL